MPEQAASQFQVLDRMPVGALVLQEDLTVLFWSRLLEEWTGISRDDILGTRIDQRFPHFGEPKYETRLRQIFEGGPPTIFSSQLHPHLIPVPLPDGGLRIQLTTVTAVRKPDSKGHYALLTIEDVTELTRRVQDLRRLRDQALTELEERRKAEEALRESEAELDTIFNSSPVAMILFDEDITIRKANGAATMAANRKAVEMIGLRGGEALRCIHHFDDPRGCGFGPECERCTIRATVEETFKTGRPHYQVEAKLTVEHEGTQMELFLLVSAVCLNIAGRQNVLLSIQDITEHMRAKEQLRINEERLELALEGTDDGLWDSNMVTGEVYFSPRYERMLGYEPGEMERKIDSWEKLVHPDDQKAVFKKLNDHLEGRTASYESEHRVRTKSGEWLWIMDRGKVVERDADGKPLRITGTHTDISRRHAAEVALQQAHDELEQRVEERTAKLQAAVETLNHEITERKKAEEIIQQRTEDLSLINDLNSALNRGASLKEVIQLLSDRTREMFSSYGATVYLLDEDRCYLAMQNLALKRKTLGLLEKLMGQKVPLLKIPLEPGSLHQEVMQSGKTWLTEDHDAIDRWTSEYIGAPGQLSPRILKQAKKLAPQIRKLVGIENLVVIPLISAGRPIGMMEITTRTASSESVVRRLETIAGQLTAIIRRVQAEEEIRRYVQELTIISEVSTTLSTCDSVDDILRLVGEKVYEQHDKSYVLITLADRTSGVINLREHFGLDKHLGKILKTLGKDPKDMTFSAEDLTKEEQQQFTSGRLVILPGGVYDLVMRKVPKPVCNAVEKLLGIDRIYGMGFALGATPFGAVMIMLLKGTPLRHKSAIEEIIKQASSVIYRRWAEEARRESQERYRSVIESSPGYIFLLDRTGHVLDIGVTKGEDIPEILVRSHIYDVVHEDDQQHFQDEIEACFRESSLREFEIKSPDQSITYQVLLSPVVRPDGETENVVCNIFDITDRQRLEAEMLRSAKMESLGVMAGGLAHDFNNFLMSIMLNVGTARLRTGEDKKIQDLLKAAEESIQKAKGITQQLLTFTRGGVPIKSSMSLQPIIKESAKFTLHGSRARLRFDLPEDLWPVEIDPGQINQVINNLALNAVQAMPHGGHLTVTARNVTIEQGDHRTALQPGNYVEVAVKDEGLGIPPEGIDSIFDPYYTTRERGTGLGLFSVYSIIERHGGWITVESEVDQGTTFTFYLPAAAGAEVAITTSEIKKGSGRVLVMDDDDTICLGLTALLGELGYEVETTADGEEALERYAEALKSDRPFDAVILDLTVPGGMGGAEAIGLLRELDPRVRAVVSSGYSTDPVMVNYREHGFKAVLVKPFQPADLSKAMDQVLG